MERLKAIDAEYMIKRDEDKMDSLIIGVVSKSLNASCWLRIEDAYLSCHKIKGILEDLERMESSMVYQANKGI